MYHIIVMALGMTFCGFAQAKDRVYLIKGAEQTVVITKGDVKEGQGDTLKMRDPNLGGKSVAVTKVVVKKAPVAKTTLKPKEKSTMAFSPMRIGGSVRMPRVDFGRVSLPGGIRDESVDTNFIQKSLSTGP